MHIYLIGEIGQSHDGSLGIAHSYIDALADLGVDAVKFQVHLAEAESSIHEPFRINFSYQDHSRYAYWQRMQFTLDQWRGLRNHCSERGVDFVASPFSCAAVNLLRKLNIDYFKIGSGEVSNHLMLDLISQSGKPVLLSTGMSTISEIDSAVTRLSANGCQCVVFQCTSEYPTQPSTWGLNVIPEMLGRYSNPIGFSDHSGDIYAPICAATLGATFIEFHVVFDKLMFGPDSKASLELGQVSDLVTAVRQIEVAHRSPVDKSLVHQYTQVREIFGKSLCVSSSLPVGHVLQVSDLETKKPAKLGIPPRDYMKVISKPLKRPLSQWDFLNWEDLE